MGGKKFKTGHDFIGICPILNAQQTKGLSTSPHVVRCGVARRLQSRHHTAQQRTASDVTEP